MRDTPGNSVRFTQGRRIASSVFVILLLACGVCLAGTAEAGYEFSFDQSGRHFHLTIRDGDGPLTCEGEIEDAAATIAVTAGTSEQQLRLRSAMEQDGLRIRIETVSGCPLEFHLDEGGEVTRVETRAEADCGAQSVLGSDLYQRVRRGYLRLNMADRGWMDGEDAADRVRVVNTLGQFLVLEAAERQ